MRQTHFLSERVVFFDLFAHLLLQPLILCDLLRELTFELFDNRLLLLVNAFFKYGCLSRFVIVALVFLAPELLHFRVLLLLLAYFVSQLFQIFGIPISLLRALFAQCNLLVQLLRELVRDVCQNVLLCLRGGLCFLVSELFVCQILYQLLDLCLTDLRFRCQLYVHACVPVKLLICGL